DSGLSALSRDGNHLALANSPVKIDGDWLTKFAVVGASSGATEAVFEVKGQSTYGFAAFSPDGRSLYLNQFGEGGTKLRVFDVPSATLLPAVTSEGAGLTQNGFRTPGIVSPDGRWMFSLDAGSATTNCTSTDGPTCIANGMPPYVLALDLVSRRAATVALPVEQRSGDFEKYLLWSLAVAADGATVYAINPALGVIDEIDARQMTIRRTKSITVSRADQGAWAAIGSTRGATRAGRSRSSARATAPGSASSRSPRSGRRSFASTARGSPPSLACRGAPHGADPDPCDGDLAIGCVRPHRGHPRDR